MRTYYRAEKVDLRSGNVFAALDLPDAEERLLKAELATKIGALVRRKVWTKTATTDTWA